jgi:hypothetical protein
VAGLGGVPGHCVSIAHVPFLGRRTEAYGLSDRQSTDASDRAREKLTRCRQLLGSTASMTPPPDATSRTDYRDRVEALTGVSLRVCPACHHGQMVVIERLVPARLPGLIPDTS